MTPTVPAMLNADGYLFGTTADFGYMSGAVKRFLDQ
jgi:multimeric flavodoxin WrbA